MRKLEHCNLLLMLIILIAVGQMTQTIYVPVIADISAYFGEHDGAVQGVMGAYLLFYGFSQLFYGPISDNIGRRPVILIGLIIYLIATVIAIFAFSLQVLIIASAIQGLGIGVAGVMARTMPRDLYIGTVLRYANSILNMGILVSPLLAPMIGGVISYFFGWHVTYIFLLLLGSFVFISIWKWFPETYQPTSKKRNMLLVYYALLSNTTFDFYLLILIGGLAGVVVFESSSGVLLGDILGLNGITVSVLFILPIPAAFLGAWYAGHKEKTFYQLMWRAVFCCVFAAIIMWLPGWLGFMNVLSLLIPAGLFFFGAGMLFPLATTGAMEPFPYLAGAAGALVGGLQNIGAGMAAWLSAHLPQNGQFSLGMLMFAMSILIVLCWLPLAYKIEKK